MKVTNDPKISVTCKNGSVFLACALWPQRSATFLLHVLFGTQGGRKRLFTGPREKKAKPVFLKL